VSRGHGGALGAAHEECFHLCASHKKTVISVQISTYLLSRRTIRGGVKCVLKETCSILASQFRNFCTVEPFPLPSLFYNRIVTDKKKN